jgi:hypothetical protein
MGCVLLCYRAAVLERNEDVELIAFLPLHEVILNCNAPEPIDWNALRSYAASFQRESQRGLTYTWAFASLIPSTNLSHIEHLTYEDYRASLKRQLASEEGINWDESKHDYYLIHNKKRAFIVRSVNMHAALSDNWFMIKRNGGSDASVRCQPLPNLIQYATR